MRRISISLVAAFLMTAIGFSQAVTDRNVIPLAVNLNQVLRLNIVDGGNIEFVFNTIDDYKEGLSGDQATSSSANTAASEGIYRTNFTVASSTQWLLRYGAENATLVGVDDDANTLALNNIGFSITEAGSHGFETAGNAKGTTAGSELFSQPTDNISEVTALQAYPTTVIEDNDSATQSNAGDDGDNDFTFIWRCGTTEAGAVNPMNTQYLIDQTVVPDRYVVNVLFDLQMDQ